jgi:YHS domain-containing protein
MTTGFWAGARLGMWGLCGLFLAGCEEKQASEKDGYPLKVCVVSGEPLGSMGEPAAIVYEGKTVKFCCSGCEEDFRKDPPTYLAKITNAKP